MNPQQASIDAAFRYLASRKALPKLATPCPVLGRDVVLYKPINTNQHQAMNAYRQVISNLESRIAKAEAALKIAQANRRQADDTIMETSTNIAAMRQLSCDLIEFTSDDEPGTPEEAKPLRLEVGKRYVRRDGAETGFLMSHRHGFVDPGPPEMLYPYGGMRRIDESPEDLIAEYVEPDSSEGWEFFQEGTEYFWAYPKDSVEGLFYARGRLSWRRAEQTKEETIRYSATPIPNLPPGTPMP